MLKDWFLGIDGGGTKTALCAVSQRTGRILSGLSGSSAWREKGIHTLASELSAAVDALHLDSDILGAAVGIPCYGESIGEDRALDKALKEVFPGVPLYICNDAEVGWAGSLTLQSGVNVVAGTGSIAYGRGPGGRTARCGGWDEFYSDEGSGYWLGRKMLQLFTKQSDGRTPRGPLHRIVRAAFSLSYDMQLIEHVRRYCLDSRKHVAALQRFLLAAALEGDADAAALYQQAAGELFAMAEAVRRQLDIVPEGWRVSLTGGLVNAGAILLAPFSALAQKAGAVLIQAEYSPAEGAVLLAAERFAPDFLQSIMRHLDANIR